QIERGNGIAPDLPARARARQSIEEPALLLGPEDALGGLVLAEIGDLGCRERNARGGFPAIEGAPGIENLGRLLGRELREVLRGERLRFRATERILRPIAALIGEEDFDVAAPAYGPVGRETAQRCEVIRLLSEATVVEVLDRCIAHLGRIEALQR